MTERTKTSVRQILVRAYCTSVQSRRTCFVFNAFHFHFHRCTRTRTPWWWKCKLEDEIIIICLLVGSNCVCQNGIDNLRPEKHKTFRGGRHFYLVFSLFWMGVLNIFLLNWNLPDPNWTTGISVKVLGSLHKISWRLCEGLKNQKDPHEFKKGTWGRKAPFVRLLYQQH